MRGRGVNVTALSLGFGIALGALASQFFLTQSLLDALISGILAGALILIAIYVVKRLES